MWNVLALVEKAVVQAFVIDLLLVENFLDVHRATHLLLLVDRAALFAADGVDSRHFV